MYVNTVDTSHRISNAFNVTYVDAVNAKDIDSTHISVHNFLNIQLIFNLKKFWKAETQGCSAIPLNAMYVNTVDASDKYF